MSTVVITGAQDKVTCPSCGAIDTDSWEWAGSEWEFTCGTCGAVHVVQDRSVSVTLWIERIPKNREALIRENRLGRCPVCNGVIDERGPDICPNGGWCKEAAA